MSVMRKFRAIKTLKDAKDIRTCGCGKREIFMCENSGRENWETLNSRVL